MMMGDLIYSWMKKTKRKVKDSRITKCDKCGKIIEGGRIKLVQHKKEFHSY